MLRAAAPNPKPPSAPTTPRTPSRWLQTLSLVYLGWLAVILVVMRTLGGFWAPATVLLFLPRFVWLAPLPLLAWWSWRRQARWLWLAHALSWLLVLGPIMNLNLPLARFFRPVPPSDRVRVLTLNQGTGSLDFDSLKSLMERDRVDVICLQEGPGAGGGPDPELVKMLSTLGWTFSKSQMIASRLPILTQSVYREETYPEYGFWSVRIHQLDVRTRAGRVIRVANIHMPTVRVGFRKLFQGDPGALGRLNRWRQSQVEVVITHTFGDTDNPVIIAGDFNTPPESRILDPLRAAGGRFGFEQVGVGYGYTRPSLLPFVAIDHIVASPDWTFTRCDIGPAVGSDHRPLFAELALPALKRAQGKGD